MSSNDKIYYLYKITKGNSIGILNVFRVEAGKEVSTHQQLYSQEADFIICQWNGLFTIAKDETGLLKYMEFNSMTDVITCIMLVLQTTTTGIA